MITQYYVVRSNTLNTLMKEVNQMITEGWQPLDSARSGLERGDIFYMQTMVVYLQPVVV